MNGSAKKTAFIAGAPSPSLSFFMHLLCRLKEMVLSKLSSVSFVGQTCSVKMAGTVPIKGHGIMIYF